MILEIFLDKIRDSRTIGTYMAREKLISGRAFNGIIAGSYVLVVEISFSSPESVKMVFLNKSKKKGRPRLMISRSRCQG